MEFPPEIITSWTVASFSQRSHFTVQMVSAGEGEWRNARAEWKHKNKQAAERAAA